MRNDFDTFKDTSPQYVQADTVPGCVKGFVVDNRDPSQAGRVRVAIYGVQGDYPGLDPYTLTWAEPMLPAGTFAVPELFDRVWVSFDAGDKENPMYFGTWIACPMGDGTLPVNKRKGSEVPFEAWNSHDLYPETIMPGASKNGNRIWINDLWLNRKYMASSINMVDIAGKFFKIKTVHMNCDRVWSPVEEVPEGKNSLYQYAPGENQSIRFGHESAVDLPCQPGSIEFGHQRLKRSLITAAQDFSQDQMTLGGTREESSIPESWVSRHEGSNMAMSGSSLFLNADSFVFVNTMMTPPKRWD